MKGRTDRIQKLAVIFTFLLSIGCSGNRIAVRKDSPEQATTERERVYFNSGKSSIRPQDQPVLNRIASRLMGDAKSVAIVEGHTDRIGSSRSNEVLAEDRARAVRVYLRDQGADVHRMTVTSKGEREPLAIGKGRKALEKNRRVEIIMTLTGEKR